MGVKRSKDGFPVEESIKFKDGFDRIRLILSYYGDIGSLKYEEVPEALKNQIYSLSEGNKCYPLYFSEVLPKNIKNDFCESFFYLAQEEKKKEEKNNKKIKKKFQKKKIKEEPKEEEPKEEEKKNN